MIKISRSELERLNCAPDLIRMAAQSFPRTIVADFGDTGVFVDLYRVHLIDRRPPEGSPYLAPIWTEYLQ